MNNRRSVARGARHYTICGRRAIAPKSNHATARARGVHRRAGLVPGATLFLILIFSVFVLQRPPQPPDDPQKRTPIVGVAHYSFADFAAASH